MKLSDVCFEMHQGINTVADKVKYCECGTPILQSKNITNGILDLEDVRFVNENDYNKYKEKYIPHKGNILLSNIGTIGKSLLIEEEKNFLIAWNIFLIKVNESKINSKFLNFYFQYLDMSNYYNKYLTGGTVKFINKKTMENIEIPNISLVNQIEIANKLEKVQKMIDIRKKQIEELDKLIKSQFVEMFGNVNDNKNSYEIKTLSEVFEFIKDGTHSTPTYTDDKINGIKFLSAKDVTKGIINWENIKYIPLELHEQLVKRVKPQKDDILLAKNGTTGVCAKVDRDEIFDIYVSLALLRPKEEYLVDYLVQAINNDMTKEQFDRSLKGVGVPNLHLGEIQKVKIIVPPIELQNKFADIVKQIDKQKFEIQKNLEEVQKLQESLMNKYFG